MTHGSLFSGIGGFDLAAQRAGIDNVFQVEIDTFCQKVLSKNFPNVLKYKDIKEFKGYEYEREIDIISGGFPCQPFSVAGKRKGKADDRYIWEEMLRVISEVKPSWVVAENVGGLINIEDGVVFEQVLFVLENIGYEVQPYIIPACAVGAPHRRDRVWIVAYSDAERCIRRSSRSANNRNGVFQDKQAGKISRGATARCNNNDCPKNYVAYSDGASAEHTISTGRDLSASKNEINPDTEGKRLQGFESEQSLRLHGQFDRIGGGQRGSWSENWYEVATRLCRMDDGLPGKLYKLGTSDRVARLKALGNAIVPQVAYHIFKAITEIGNDSN